MVIEVKNVSISGDCVYYNEERNIVVDKNGRGIDGYALSVSSFGGLVLSEVTNIPQGTTPIRYGTDSRAVYDELTTLQEPYGEESIEITRLMCVLLIETDCVEELKLLLYNALHRELKTEREYHATKTRGKA